MTRETFSLTLKSYHMITPQVRHMVFAIDSNKPFIYTPGQFITFHFTMDDKIYNRSYSIASIPSQTNDIEIAVSPFPGGPGTEFLFHLKPGDTVQTTGPFGRLILRDEQPERYILVATGTGVTPYRCMLPQLQQRLQKQNLQVVILQGVQKTEDLLYGDDFKKFAEQEAKLEFHAFYSRQEAEEHNSFEHHGYVQHYFPKLNLNPKTDIIYLCGNPNMIDEAFNLLIEKGFDTQTIRREKYISPKQR